MKTRKQRLNNEVSHEAYYSQFVTQYVRNVLGYTIGLEKIMATGGDMSKISLSVWDKLPIAVGMKHMLQEAGDTYSLAGKNCIYKEGARQLYKEMIGETASL